MPVKLVKLIRVSVTKVFNNTLVVTEADPTVPDTLVPTGMVTGPVTGEPTVGADPMYTNVVAPVVAPNAVTTLSVVPLVNTEKLG